VWTAIRNAENTMWRDAKNLFDFHLDHQIPEIAGPR
jgi:hypothetical protein